MSQTSTNMQKVMEITTRKIIFVKTHGYRAKCTTSV